MLNQRFTLTQENIYMNFRTICAAITVSAVCTTSLPAFAEVNFLAPGPVIQNSFTPCKVDFSPGEKYHTRKRQWQGCATILRTPKGTLYAGWYSGGPGEGLLNYSLMVKSTDGGITWNREPLLVIDSLTDKKIQSLDIQFWLDPRGRFWYFWTQRDYNFNHKDPRHLSVWAMICDDPDAQELKWSKPRFVSPGFLRSQPTILKDGRWILCAYDWVDNYYRYSESYDQGKTWYRRIAGKKHSRDFAFDETMMIESRNGTLRLLARPAKGVGFLIESRSADGGKTWSDGVLTDIPNPAGRFFIKRLRSGNILLLNNWNSRDRYDLTAAISTDDGKTWQHKLLLDPRRCTYPDAVEGADGELFIVHDFSRGDFKEILISRLTERDIMTGLNNHALASSNSFLRHIINKAPTPAELTPEEERLFYESLSPAQKEKRRGSVKIDIQGDKFKNTLSQVTPGTSGKISMRNKNMEFQYKSDKILNGKWQEYSFSFVPQTDRVILVLRAEGFADYDDFKIENGTLYNPSFEAVNRANEIDGWRYYLRKSARIGRDDAAAGKNYMTCSSKILARQVLYVKPGKKVTVSFKARQGQKFVLSNTPWVSSGKRQLR